jgi:predicted nuclease of predicted toxin-antitoxin system
VKLLFDENLSPRLVDTLSSLYPHSAHVHQCQLGSSEDSAIWDYARANGFTIISKDSDFQERSILFGAPPKVVWLRVKNCTSAEIGAMLRAAFPAIKKFIQDDAETCLILDHP